MSYLFLSCTEQKIITVQFHFSSSQPRKIQESATQNRVSMQTQKPRYQLIIDR